MRNVSGGTWEHGRGRRRVAQAVAVLSGVVVSSGAQGQDAEITWFSIDGGGGRSSGGGFVLDGSIGQPDAGPTMSGGAFTVTGGFWVVAAGGPCSIADTTAAFGVLDINDILTFATSYSLSDPAADLFADGVFDINDVLVFANAFSMGCP